MTISRFCFFLAVIVAIVSCEQPAPKKEKIKLNNAKFEAFAVESFRQSHKTGTAEAKNIKVDTVLAISSSQAERIKIAAFELDYQFSCKHKGIPYSKKTEQDSVRNWLKRAYKLPKNDTVGYRVKFNLDYVIDGKLQPDIWMKCFDKNYKSYDELDGPLLVEEFFLVEGI